MKAIAITTALSVLFVMWLHQSHKAAMTACEGQRGTVACEYLLR